MVRMAVGTGREAGGIRENQQAGAGHRERYGHSESFSEQAWWGVCVCICVHTHVHSFTQTVAIRETCVLSSQCSLLVNTWLLRWREAILGKGMVKILGRWVQANKPRTWLLEQLSFSHRKTP